MQRALFLICCSMLAIISKKFNYVNVCNLLMRHTYKFANTTFNTVELYYRKKEELIIKSKIITK